MLCLLRSFAVTHACTRRMFNLKDSVDLFQRKTRGFNIEEPNDGEPSEVENGKDDVESIAD